MEYQMKWLYDFIIASGCNADTASVITGIVILMCIYFPLRIFVSIFTGRK